MKKTKSGSAPPGRWKLRKGEAVTLAVIAAIAVCMLIVQAIIQMNQQRINDEIAAFEESQRVELAMGETVVLDVVEDEKALGPTGLPYPAGLDWVSGACEMTVLSAGIYGSAESAGIDEVELTLPLGGRDLLVCEVRVKNIDAVSGRDDQNCFNVTFIQGPSACELVYFNGTFEGALEEKETFCYELSPGEEATYRMAYVVSDGIHDISELSYLYLGLSASTRSIWMWQT